MKFIVASGELQKALQIVSGVISSSQSRPILENFLFELDNEILKITASDGETTLITSVGVKSDDSGKIAVPAKMFQDVIKSFGDQPLTFSVKESESGEGGLLEILDEKDNYFVALDNAEIKYSTVQNWYAGDRDGRGGIYNFVTKRGLCKGKRSKISWTQVETGSAITWKYPSVVLQGDNSIGEFYSVALTNNKMQADTGTKMIHNGKGTRSTIVSKGISAGKSQNTYRGLVRVAPQAEGVRNFTQCDSLLLGKHCGAHTVPYIEVRNPSAQIEHEATTSKISDDQLFYAMQRGLDQEAAVALIVNGFAKEVLQQLPMEFAVEAQKLLGISLEGSVG